MPFALCYLRFLVNRRLDVFEAVGDAQQAFRMPDKQISAGLKGIVEFVHEGCLSRSIEIYHHIAAEDNIEFFTKCKRGHQIESPEIDHIPDHRLDSDKSVPPALTLLKKLPHELSG